MKDYHQVWLSVHPERTAHWLKERLIDGFDIHHIDGNKNNNHPSNLVLIECSDHLMIHGGRVSRIKKVKKIWDKGPRKKTLESGEMAYNLRKKGAKWKDLHEKASIHAKSYAKHNKLPWPVPVEKPERKGNVVNIGAAISCYQKNSSGPFSTKRSSLI